MAVHHAHAKPVSAVTLADASAEPRLPRGKDLNGVKFPTLRYAPLAGQTIVSGVTSDDVIQGTLGDCFFLSSLAALAHVRPDLVDQAIRDNLDGTWTVTLYRTTGRAVDVRVDAAFPVTPAGDLPFARGLDPAELWPEVFEKAYAKLRGGYTVINAGGFASDALATLTGHAAHTHTLAALSDDAAWKILTDSLGAGLPVVTGTPFARELRKRTGRPDMAGLIDDHAYALLHAYERGGRRFVILYTPLSPADAGYSKTEPRTIELPLEDWRRFFDDVSVGTL